MARTDCVRGTPGGKRNPRLSQPQHVKPNRQGVSSPPTLPKCLQVITGFPRESMAVSNTAATCASRKDSSWHVWSSVTPRLSTTRKRRLIEMPQASQLECGSSKTSDMEGAAWADKDTCLPSWMHLHLHGILYVAVGKYVPTWGPIDSYLYKSQYII